MNALLAYLIGFRGGAAWIAKGLLFLPFVAFFADLLPPWPNEIGIAIVTCVGQIGILLWVLERYRPRADTAGTRVPRWMLLVSTTLYAVLLAGFVIQTPHGRLAKGFEYASPQAEKLVSTFPSEIEALRAATYEATRIWSPRSVSIVRFGLLVAWLALALSATLVVGRILARSVAGPRVKILFLASSPNRTKNIRLDREVRGIQEMIRPHRARLELASRWAVRPRDLLQALNEEEPEVVHFGGHGEATDELLLEDETGEPKPVDGHALAQLFATQAGRVRLVVLNACYSKPQAESIAKVVGCAVGMREKIADKTAIGFAAAFYGAIGYGRSVQEAFLQGRTEIDVEGLPHRDVPQLFEGRRGLATETVLVDV